VAYENTRLSMPEGKDVKFGGSAPAKDLTTSIECGACGKDIIQYNIVIILIHGKPFL
jgi:hypothetical protein